MCAQQSLQLKPSFTEAI